MPVSLSRVSVESTAAKVIAGAIEVKNMKSAAESTWGGGGLDTFCGDKARGRDGIITCTSH